MENGEWRMENEKKAWSDLCSQLSILNSQFSTKNKKWEFVN